MMTMSPRASRQWAARMGHTISNKTGPASTPDFFGHVVGSNTFIVYQGKLRFLFRLGIHQERTWKE